MSGRPTTDRVPEYVQYTDTGCQHWHSCLTCPLMECVYVTEDNALAVKNGRQVLIRKRYREVLRGTGRPPLLRDLAEEFGVSLSTLSRVVWDLRPRRER